MSNADKISLGLLVVTGFAVTWFWLNDIANRLDRIIELLKKKDKE